MEYETRNKSETRNAKRFDLPDRTLAFAKDVRIFLHSLPQNRLALEDYKQLTRSSGSIGANYLEANESLSKKDFAMRIKIAKKEARESIFWLELLSVSEESEQELHALLTEATEIMNLLGAILRTTKP
jgi:four helix bundle protein